jgi:hypothetical protein
MRIKYGVIVVVIGFIILSFCVEGWGANWRYFTSSRHGDCFYDADGITRQQNGMVRVWYKTVLNDEGRIDWVTKRGEKVKDVSYLIDLFELDCKGTRMRFLTGTSYSKAGSVLESSGSGSSDWDYINPDSLMDILFNIVCR